MQQAERQSMEVDLVCVGFGPATGGFLTTLTRAMLGPEGQPKLESRVMPGMPLQVLCYERADDISFGVSGIVTRARGIRESFPDLEPAQIPMAQPVTDEKVLYLQDPHRVSRRSAGLRVLDGLTRGLRWMLPWDRHALRLPWIPPFLEKKDGLLLSMGQFNQWVGSQLMGSGLVQIWPGTPVREPLFDGDRVVGVRLLDQGTDARGEPEAGFMPGMDVRAALTVVGDGPVGAVGQRLDERFGLPEGHHQREWAVGMKMVVELPESSDLRPGTVFHTFGYPEPEIFGFLYVYPDRLASLGIFVPSWLDSPVRTSYRYLQHWMRHPSIWRHLEGGTMRSWGAKSLQESGRLGEPHLAGDGYARIGEGSGSTNVLTGSGVDEAWTTGVQLAEAVIEHWPSGEPFTRDVLERGYVRRRRGSWVETEGRAAEHARDGFTKGVVRGLVGMGLAGLTGGRLHWRGRSKPPHDRIPSIERYCAGRIPAAELQKLQDDSRAAGTPVHDALMRRLGWPELPYDGKLLVSQQDALLIGGKVQATPGFADHVVFINRELCATCATKLCIEMCSGQAISRGDDDGPEFDREKCVHYGACLWNCAHARDGDPERSNIEFRAGVGGLHSVEN